MHTCTGAAALLSTLHGASGVHGQQALTICMSALHFANALSPHHGNCEAKRKHGLSTEQFAVPACVGSSKNLKDLHECDPLSAVKDLNECDPLPRLYTYHFQSTRVYTEPDNYCLNVVRSSPHRVGVGVPILPT